MKKYSLSAALMMAALMMVPAVTSCKDDDDKPISASELPQEAKSFLNVYYPSVDILRTIRDKDNGRVEYEVTLANGHEVTFDSNGSWKDVDAPAMQIIPAGIAPQPIADYVATNYPNDGINEISKENYGYEVELVNTIDLRFSADGTFIGIDR